MNQLELCYRRNQKEPKELKEPKEQFLRFIRYYLANSQNIITKQYHQYNIFTNQDYFLRYYCYGCMGSSSREICYRRNYQYFGIIATVGSRSALPEKYFSEGTNSQDLLFLIKNFCQPVRNMLPKYYYRRNQLEICYRRTII